MCPRSDKVNFCLVCSGNSRSTACRVQSVFGYTHQEIHEKNWIDLFIAEPFRDNDLLNHLSYTGSSKDSVVNSRIELMGYRGDEEFPIEISIKPIRIESLNFFLFLYEISANSKTQR